MFEVCMSFLNKVQAVGEENLGDPAESSTTETELRSKKPPPQGEEEQTPGEESIEGPRVVSAFLLKVEGKKAAGKKSKNPQEEADKSRFDGLCKECEEAEKAEEEARGAYMKARSRAAKARKSRAAWGDMMKRMSY